MKLAPYLLGVISAQVYYITLHYITLYLYKYLIDKYHIIFN